MKTANGIHSADSSNNNNLKVNNPHPRVVYSRHTINVRDMMAAMRDHTRTVRRPKSANAVNVNNYVLPEDRTPLMSKFKKDVRVAAGVSASVVNYSAIHA